MRSVVAASSHASGVNRGSGTMRRPAYVDVSTAVTPAMWNGGTAKRTASSSSADANSIVLSWYARSWSCSSTAALGSADVPLVNSSTAGASGASGYGDSPPGIAIHDSSATTAGCTRSSRACRASAGSR